jgi:hypothetical protein
LRDPDRAGGGGDDFASFAALERLSQAPVQSIVDVRYLDAAGVEQVLDPAVYEFVNVDADVLRPRIRLAFGKSWPAIRAARTRCGSTPSSATRWCRSRSSARCCC